MPRDQEGKQVIQAAPAAFQGTSTHSQLQPSSDSNGLVHKLLSLPSFGKVVYRSTSMSSFHNIVSKQHASGSAFPKALGVSSNQQMLMQGHASLGTRPPSLDFDSQFESGNLQKAVQASLACTTVTTCTRQRRRSWEMPQCRWHSCRQSACIWACEC